MPAGLSLSKPRPLFDPDKEEGQPFDTLRANGSEKDDVAFS
jgi:hypothetical protein